jgi:hypothetical protein
MIPFPRRAQHARQDSDAPSSSLDPDTSQLLPERASRRMHHVWIQGRLAPVKKAFVPRTAKLASKSAVLLVPSPPGSPRAASSSGGSRLGDTARQARRRSFDDARLDGNDEESGADDGGDELEDEAREESREESRATAARSSSQLRGYGIGGAGNIRRPTDVIHGPTRPRLHVHGTDSPRSASSVSTDADAPSNLRRMLRLVPDKKRKC